jgi:hypothetical protein
VGYIYMEQSQKRRSAKRRDFSLKTSVRHGPFERAAITLEDLSFTGFAGTCAVPIKIGRFVSIALPPIGLVRAKIVWVREDRIGGEFLSPVDVRRCFPEMELPSRS